MSAPCAMFKSCRLSVLCTEVRFASFFSGGFIIVVNPPERKLAKRTSVLCSIYVFIFVSLTDICIVNAKNYRAIRSDDKKT